MQTHRRQWERPRPWRPAETGLRPRAPPPGASSDPRKVPVPLDAGPPHLTGVMQVPPRPVSMNEAQGCRACWGTRLTLPSSGPDPQHPRH